MKFDGVQIAADDTDVFNGRLGESMPRWARYVGVYLVASDSDWQWSVSLGGEEMLRDACPNAVAADNVDQLLDLKNVSCVKQIAGQRSNFEILVNVNVVTAGVGMCYIVWFG